MHRPVEEIDEEMRLVYARLANLRTERRRAVEGDRARRLHRIVQDYVAPHMTTPEICRKWSVDRATLYAMMASVGAKRNQTPLKSLSRSEHYQYRTLRRSMTRDEALAQLNSVKALCLTVPGSAILPGGRAVIPAPKGEP